MDVHVITKKDQFEAIYPKFKESSIINENPHIHLIGLDVEFISRATYPNIFESCDWIKSDKSLTDIIVCKLQLASNTMCLVIDLCILCKHDDLPTNLVNILKSDSWIKTGVGISNDISYLSSNFCLGQCNGCIELKIFAQLRGMETCSLVDLYNCITGLNVKKSTAHRSQDWSMDLNISQIQYASLDASMSYTIGKYFVKNNINSLNKFQKNKFNDENIANDDFDKSDINISFKLTNDNYITQLYEYAKKNKIEPPIYDLVNDTILIGNTHLFEIKCTFKNIICYGSGNTKKSAKNDTSKNMINFLNETLVS